MGVVGAELLQFDGFALECLMHAFIEVGDETKGALAVLGHAVGQHMIGEVCLAHDLCLLMAQTQDVPDELGVVVLTAAADATGAFPDLTADAFVFEVFHDRNHRRGFQREAIDRLFQCAEVFGQRIRLGGINGGLRQALETIDVFDEQLPFVGRVEHVLGILLRMLGKLGLDLLDALLLVRWQVGTRLDEAFHRFQQGTFADGGEVFRLVGLAVGDKEIP